ncbi:MULTISPECIES: glycosyltransferase family 2 protein [Mycobacterium]|uniref:glycosyltransferase family 2 protein n=1 Tax=Mycobacterium TaxID=1763 RepID=UPI001EEFE9B8|nr:MULTISPECIES: galactosyltransferase-related protein [Mycobacterium]BDB45029.1 glycosyl transferase family A [Mycobacterium kiyosense]BDE16510.1 glycosyl transferase family A [Mycobacterium sp. 20KCMC460]GLB89725.1 glycosyl transferase family A [Mycobacterium kiyosense]GLC00565.1 glycosyl transferase family A [Mycobacterium kiyosense]GLC16287.1 glycosyl transferase family A [Mycobacterium kiyosense]
MKTAVITTVHGRAGHLRRQLEGLQHSVRRPDLHVIVALGDPGVADAVSGAGAAVVDCPAQHPLPIARGRNLGADTAIRENAELLVFLDVDCIPAAALIDRYHAVASGPDHADALLCGPVTYLPPTGPGGYSLSEIRAHPEPHPARPSPADDEVFDTTDYALFWSLSFAVRTSTWQRIGGFCELYCGYGGEDTDFAQCAAARGVPMRWVGGAHAFHQHHRVTNPPVDHLDDIVRNAAVFHRRWGWWPMEGWLSSFESDGLIRRRADGRPVSAVTAERSPPLE